MVIPHIIWDPLVVWERKSGAFDGVALFLFPFTGTGYDNGRKMARKKRVAESGTPQSLKDKFRGLKMSRN